MPDDRIKAYRSTPSNVPAPEALRIARLTIDLDNQYSSVAIEAYVNALDLEKVHARAIIALVLR